MVDHVAAKDEEIKAGENDLEMGNGQTGDGEPHGIRGDMCRPGLDVFEAETSVAWR